MLSVTMCNMVHL